MNTRMLRKSLLVLTLIAALAVLVAPAFAQETTSGRSLTLTETRINENFRVQNPVRARVSNRSVDLQPGQVVVTATWAFRSHEPVQVISTLVPRIDNGRLYWSVSSVTADGSAISDDLLNQINTSIATSWRNYLRGLLGTGRVASIDITDTEMVITFVGR